MAPDDMGRTILALLAVTPEPPPVDSDPGEIAELAERMLAARAALCHELEVLGEGDRIVPATHSVPYAALIDRNARWSACLQHARHELGQRLGAGRRVRRAY
jgi:hypothetical protein